MQTQLPPPAVEPARRSWWSGPLAAPYAVAGAALAATAYVALVDPGQPGHYPLCPFKAWTGLDCPGCGGLRAVHDLTRGDVVGSLDNNAAFLLLLLPAAVLAWFGWVRRARRAARGEPAPASRLPSWTVYALVAALFAFTVVRNLPFVPFLRSGIG